MKKSDAVQQHNYPDHASVFPGFDYHPDRVRKNMEKKDYSAVCKDLVTILHYFKMAKPVALSHQQRDIIEGFVRLLIDCLINEDFLITEYYIPFFVTESVLIANLVAVTSICNTDKSLQIVSKQPKNLIRLLSLYSHRNNIRLNLDVVFQPHPMIATLWWASVITSARNNNSKLIHENLKYFLNYNNLSRYYTFNAELSRTYPQLCFALFDATYIDQARDIEIKKIINSAIKRDIGSISNISVKDPDFSNIAVISSFFYKGHAVCKSISPLIKSLKGAYRLTLIDMHTYNVEMEEGIFDEIIPFNKHAKTLQQASASGNLDEILEVNSRNIHLGQLMEIIQDKKFGVVIFPDIGLTQASIVMSNFRMAPIQIACYGHPVTSGASEIDYFIGGADAEIIENAEKNYTERLVVIPGLAASPIYPEYKLTGNRKQTDGVVINCNWGNIKFFYPHLLALRKVIEECKKEVYLRVMSIYPDNMGFIPFFNDFLALFSLKNLKVVASPVVDYQRYMQMTEECDFAIDSFPFGGYNRIVDTLFCGRPIITYEGGKAYNRLASGLLKSLGLQELVAENEQEYIDKCINMITDVEYRKAMRRKIASINLKDILFNSDKEVYFKKAIDYLIRNDAILKEQNSKKPIVIEE